MPTITNRSIFGQMGGMGGGFGGMDDGGFGGGSPFGGPGAGRRRPTRQQSAPAPPPAEITRPLALTLEELYKGGTKRLKITRRLQHGGEEEKVLEIAYKPGWKKGTKIKFNGAGHEDEYGQGQTIVFVVEEKPHGRFERLDDDAVVNCNISLVDALTGSPSGQLEDRVVEHLDGRRLKVQAPKGVSRPAPLKPKSVVLS